MDNVMYDLSQTRASSNCCDTVTSVFVKLNHQNLTTQSFSPFDEFFWQFFNGLGRMFYVVDPKETAYSSLNEVPQFYKNVSSTFILFVLCLCIVALA